MQVLNVDVPPGLLQRWVTWLAPGSQPFFLAGRQAAGWGLTVGQWPADPQLRDTYEMYGEPGRTCVAWLDEPSFLALPGPGIRGQASGHRFAWWPSLLSGTAGAGTVMAAAGVPGAAGTWMQREPFEEWLAALTKRGGRDDVPGTVLVWRATQNGQLQHAAVALGEGWALNKRSQSWQSPRTVLSVAEVIATSVLRAGI